jgi:hypothetical protein
MMISNIFMFEATVTLFYAMEFESSVVLHCFVVISFTNTFT